MELAEYALMDAAEDHMWWYRALHRRLLDALTGVDGVVLDAGCGTGGLLARLRAERPDLRTVGVEWAEPASRRAAAKSGAPVVRGSVNALPFADALLRCRDRRRPAVPRRGRSGAGAGRTAARAAPGRQAGRQHAGLRLAAVGARPAGAQRPPLHRAPARRDAARRRLRPRARRLLEQPAAAAHGGAAQAAGTQRGCLGRCPVSAMARCHVSCHDRDRASPALPPAGRADRCWRPRSDHERRDRSSLPRCPLRRRSPPASACPSSFRCIAVPPPSAVWSRRCRRCTPPAGWRSCWSTTAAPTIPARCARSWCGAPRCRSPMSSTRATSASTTRS